MRISTPDLRKIIQLYLGTDALSSGEVLTHHQRYHNPCTENMCMWFNDHMRLWNHQFIFDEVTLINLLRQTGFSRVIERKFGESEYPPLKGIERHNEDVEWMEWAYVMIFEAHKDI